MDLKYLRSVLLYLVSALLSLVLIFYIGYHIFGGFEEDLSVTQARTVTQEETLNYDGYLFREEEVLYAKTDGQTGVLYSDGEKVPKNAALVNVYARLSSEIREKIIEIDKEILLYQRSNVASSVGAYDTAAIDKQIKEMYLDIRESLQEGDTETACRKKDELLILFNKRSVIVQTTENYNGKIRELQEQKSKLTESLTEISESVYSSESGWFYSSVDGYEEIFTQEALSSLTPESFQELLSRSAATDTAGKYAVGKLVKDYQWYIALEIPKEQMRYFAAGQYYDLKFPYSGDITLSMELNRIATSVNSENAVLIFKSTVDPSDFNYLRKQTVQIVRASYSGYRVPVSALHLNEEGETGVYILSGSYVRFRTVEILFEQDGYLVVAEKPTADADTTEEEQAEIAKRLDENDMIITKGKKLYDGKIISS